MKQVVAMRAIPGSGKSSLAKQILSKANAEGKTAIICSADDFFYGLGNGTYAFDRTKISDAHKYCFKKFMKAVADDIDLIIIDNTNLSAWEISPYKTYAEVHDYNFSINEVVADQKEAFRRQQHGVPDFAHESMSNSFEKEVIPPWWEKKRILSKTNELGNASFEEESNDPLDTELDLKEKKASSNLFKTACFLSEKYRLG